jgi:chain length determinant protein tyrosine kinase EpsG
MKIDIARDTDMQPSGISSRITDTFNAVPDRAREPHGGPLGQVFVRQGRINDKDVDRVIAYGERRHLRFGEAAVKLGLISRQELNRGIAAQFGYPYLEPGAGGYSPKLVAAYDPFSTRGEALRALRLRLHEAWLTAGYPAMAVIGPTGRDGSSYIAANLAIMFSQAGESTVLVDASLKNPAQHLLFRVGNASGLSAVLAGRMPIEAATIRLPMFRDLSLVPAGVVPPNAADLLGRAELGRAIAALRQRHAIVLVDAPSFVGGIGAERVAQRCGGALLVIRQDHTRLVDARRLMDAAQGLGAAIAGSVMTQF